MKIGSDSQLPWDRTPISIAVIGDIILDEYLDGVVNRISPEAPVPVHLVKNTKSTAGGAANVARNIQLVGGHCSLVGVSGNDGAGDQLRHILRKDGVDVRHILTDGTRPTIRKTRITANHQQLARIDWEEVGPIDSLLQQELFQNLQALHPQALLISDYGKGCLPEPFLKKIIDLAQAKGIPVIVDPKGKDYTGYRGADLITPNWKEACEALGLDMSTDIPVEQLAEQLHERYQIKNILITLGADGMLGRNAKGQYFRLKAQTREVFDVSGAGDTVVALMSLGFACQLPLDGAMNLANLAAGCVVEKWGTQPILRSELLGVLKKGNRNSFGWSATRGKIASTQELVANLEQARLENKKIVFTNGCFDLLHAGHLSYLEEARSRGHLLIVGVNTDDSVRRLKGKSRPIVPCEQRMSLLAGLECVSYVTSFSEDTPEQLINLLCPDILVKGADYELHEIVGATFVQKMGGAVERIPVVPGLSTSEIISRVKTEEGVPLS